MRTHLPLPSAYRIKSAARVTSGNRALNHNLIAELQHPLLLTN